MKPIAILSLLILLGSDLLQAQQWQWVSQIAAGSPNNSSDVHPDGTLYVSCGPAFYEVSTSGATLATNNYSGAGLQIHAFDINSKGNLVIGATASGPFTLAGQSWSTTGSHQNLFIAELNTQYQASWSKMISGTGNHEIHGLGVDKNDNVYCAGLFANTSSFSGKTLTGKSKGSSFAARLSPAGNLDWVYADSSDNSYSRTHHLSVNPNGESLISIESSDGSYFYFNKATFSPAANQPYYYGDQFALILKADGTPLYARSDKNSKAYTYFFTGLTSDSWYRLGNGFWNGDRLSDLQEYNFAGDTTGGYNGNFLDSDDSYISFLGVIDDNPYFLCTKSYYDQNGEQFENFVSVFEQQKMKHLIQFSGKVSNCHLHKRYDGVFILDGTFTGSITLDNFKLTPVNYYLNTFIASFDPEAKTATIENEFQAKLSLFPNPVQDKLFLSNRPGLSGVKIINALGQETPCVLNDNSIDVSHLTTGVYFLTVRSAESIRVAKFVKN